MAWKITGLQLSLTEFVKGLSKHQRTAATHIWAILISPEEGNAKPYALPVQCIPYVGLTDNQARELVNKVIQEMVNRGMCVAGMFHNSALPVFMCLAEMFQIVHTSIVCAHMHMFVAYRHAWCVKHILT